MWYIIIGNQHHVISTFQEPSKTIQEEKNLSNAENGPFRKLSVVTHITPGLNNHPEAQLKMFSMSGICIYDETINLEKGQQKHSIDLNNKLTVPGVYIISLVKDSEIYSQKILW